MSRPLGKKTKTIDSLWAEHEQILKEAGYDYDKFKANMYSLASTNTTPKGKPSISKAWNAFKHKEIFVSKKERGAENLWEAISEQGDLKTVRKDVFGWRTSKKKMRENMVWNEDDERYEYTNPAGEVYVFELITGTHGSQYWKWTKR